MFGKFKFEPLPLGEISLDFKNPRIVSQKKLANEGEIIAYLFEHEDLLSFIKKISRNGKNRGAERPYVAKEKSGYVVIEGNTRIAAYKVLVGLASVPEKFKAQIPHVSDEQKTALLVVDCSIAPSREALLPIMAESHFGEGDKSKWGYLGSRKALYDEFKGGKTPQQLAKIFGITASEVSGFLVEYELYQEALKLGWTSAEKQKLLDPGVAFNPPVRFLQTQGHKERIGIDLDRTNVKVVFNKPDAKAKLKHLVRNLVVAKKPGLSGPSSYEAVFKDFVDPKTIPAPSPSPSPAPTPAPTPGAGGGSKVQPKKLKAHALFNYPVSVNSALLSQLMNEASRINSKTFPAASTMLLRNIIESLLKYLIESAGANPQKNSLSLSDAISICRGNKVHLSKEEKKVLSELEKHHLNYLNIGAHGGAIPNQTRLLVIRDVVDEFVRTNI